MMDSRCHKLARLIVYADHMDRQRQAEAGQANIIIRCPMPYFYPHCCVFLARC